MSLILLGCFFSLFLLLLSDVKDTSNINELSTEGILAPQVMSHHPKSSAGYGVLLTTLSQNKQANMTFWRSFLWWVWILRVSLCEEKTGDNTDLKFWSFLGRGFVVEQVTFSGEVDCWSIVGCFQIYLFLSWTEFPFWGANLWNWCWSQQLPPTVCT